MKIEMNSARQVTFTPETRFEAAMLEAWLREGDEAVPPVVGAIPFVPAANSAYVQPKVAQGDPLGLRRQEGDGR